MSELGLRGEMNDEEVERMKQKNDYGWFIGWEFMYLRRQEN